MWAQVSRSAPRKSHLFLLGLVLAGAIAAITIFTGVYGGNPAINYQATIESVIPNGARAVAVSFQVSNLETFQATPTCEITLNTTKLRIVGRQSFKASAPIPQESSSEYVTQVRITPGSMSDISPGLSSITCQ